MPPQKDPLHASNAHLARMPTFLAPLSARNVWKIRSPTPVECPLVILVKLVKKVIPEVPNAPVAMRVKQVPVSTERVFHAHKDSIAKQTMNLLHRVQNVVLGNTWVVAVPSIAWIVIRGRMKTTLGPPSAKTAKRADTKSCLEIHRVHNVMLGSTWVVVVPWIVWIATRGIFKTWPERNRAKIVWKIRSPTAVDCRLVICVKLVKKVIQVAPNAPVATRVKRVWVIMALVKHVMRVNFVHPMTLLLIRAHHAKVAIIKQVRAKRLVCRAYLARMKTIPVQPNVKIAR
jgi:hypothetical protein